MLKRKSHTFTIAVILVFALKSLAQDFNDDARFWLYMKLDKDITKKVNAHFLLQNRFNNNMNEYSQVYGDFGLTYKLNKHLRFITDYVYGKKRNLDGSYSNIHQVYGGFYLRKKINKFVLVYRNLLQAQFRNINSSDKGTIPKVYERNKLTVKYELNKRYAVFAAEELNLPLYRFSEYYISRNRTFFGSSYNLSKKSNIEAYFLFQRKFKLSGQPSRDFIYGVTYSYSF